MKDIGRYRHKLLAALAAVLLVLCCGCAPMKLPEPKTLEPQFSSTQSPQPTATAQRGGVLRVPMPLHPKTLHPLFVSESQLRNLYSMIFESLISFNERMEPVAQLATGWEYREEDGVFLIHLRSGVRWHGLSSEVTASDVEFTINTILEHEDSVYHKIVSEYIQAVTVQDMDTLVITPQKAGYEFYFALSFPVLPMSVYAGETAKSNRLPVGSGPFSVTAMSFFAHDASLSLSANAQWWKKQPFIERVEAKGYEDNDAMIRAFMAGELDCVPTDRRTTDVYTTFDGVSDYEYQSRYYDFLALNLKNKLFQEIELRRAISYAIDRGTLISTVYLNHGMIAELPFAPDSFLNNTSIVRYDYNPNLAESLLSDAGWEPGEDGVRRKGKTRLSFTVTCFMNDADPIRTETARMIARQLAQVGIEVQIRALAAEEFTAAVEKGDYEVLLTGYYLSDIPSAAFAFSSKGSGNLSFYRDEKMDQLIAACETTAEKSLFMQKYAELQSYAAEQVPQIGLLFRRQTLLHRRELVPMNVVRDASVYESVDKWYFTE